MQYSSELRMTLNGEGSCIFRCLRPEDVSPLYITSLNAEKRYIETKAVFVTMDSQKGYVRNVASSGDAAIAGLFHDEAGLVGTSGMQNLRKPCATLGVFVFDGWRGRGLGAVLVWSACQLATRMTGLTSFWAGMKLDNIASLKSFLGCGFEKAGEDEAYYKVKCGPGAVRRPESIASGYEWVDVNPANDTSVS